MKKSQKPVVAITGALLTLFMAAVSAQSAPLCDSILLRLKKALPLGNVCPTFLEK
jgi:hypothetical protein